MKAKRNEPRATATPFVEWIIDRFDALMRRQTDGDPAPVAQDSTKPEAPDSGNKELL